MNIQVELLEKESIQSFKVIGEIDAFTAPMLKEKLSAVQDMPNTQVEVDLSAVAYIDSTGLGIFVGFYKALKKQNSKLKIVGLNTRIERLFEITGLNEIIDIEPKDGEQ